MSDQPLRPQGNHTPRDISSELFALENLAQPAKDAPRTINFVRLIKKTFEAIRRLGEEPPLEGLALVNLLIEYSYACERTYVYCPEHSRFWKLLKWHKTKGSRVLGWLRDKKVILEAGSYFTFHPALYIRLKPRPDLDVLQVELCFENPECQPNFPREVNLNDLQLLELAPVAPHATASCVTRNSVAPHATAPGRLYNVESDRSLLNVQRASSKGSSTEQHLRELREFLEGKDGREAAAAEMANSGGMWRKLCGERWSDVFATMRWILDRERTGNPTRTTRAARLTSELHDRVIGPEAWDKLFDSTSKTQNQNKTPL